MNKSAFWKNKRVLITGHSGFKGSWLSLLLHERGAIVNGISMSSWRSCPIHSELAERFIFKDELDYDLSHDFNYEIDDFLNRSTPDIVFHLAAQPIVLKGYKEPTQTWKTNLLSTLNLLDSFNRISANPTVIVITTDKVYKNKEWLYPYRENDELGGLDPYSASKASVELLVASWIHSYCQAPNNMRLATVRAGNVIGGGDFAEDRIITDLVSSISQKSGISLRHPNAVRPWQHVLDPINGYVKLAEKLHTAVNLNDYQTSFNFGPEPSSFRTVSELVRNFISNLPSDIYKPQISESQSIYKETQFLSLDSAKSRMLLDWRPKWDFETSVRKTAQWYNAYIKGEDLFKHTLKDVHSHLNEALK